MISSGTCGGGPCFCNNEIIPRHHVIALDAEGTESGRVGSRGYGIVSGMDGVI